jgi:hypothetical protein
MIISILNKELIYLKQSKEEEIKRNKLFMNELEKKLNKQISDNLESRAINKKFKRELKINQLNREIRKIKDEFYELMKAHNKKEIRKLEIILK